ncbi:F-box and WD-40 domain protein 1/11 [Emericellopsis cladophorae]|uniref:F-box and WD-40 domain protein 1/11 n=1 Tax=Emericellopsis cladophorae TaxID=2686198 RepID=A0A9Q0BBQ1_9HYPO|nr:F-box and WD-40 domain protein 1/11 [Emericellopsis cladophorae]KAI6778730.1 F-box and WD-40 domain protein 1/11 [Emericellopsis cladophorae]
MDTFSPTHQPDEGYSEDPLGTSGDNELSSALSNVRTEDLPAWIASNAAYLPLELKKELTMALLNQLPTAAVCEIVERLSPRLYIDFVRYLPTEVCLKILNFLEPDSLINVLRTCRAWYELSLDYKLWERMYHLEGWKVVRNEITKWEQRVTHGLTESIGHLQRMQSTDGHSSKIRRVARDDGDTDIFMSDSMLCLQFDADPAEDLLVSGSSDSDIIVWKFSTGEILQKITKAHYESVLNVKFDKDVLITSSKDKSIKIFNRKPLRFGELGYDSDVFLPAVKKLQYMGYEPELARELPIKPPFSMIGRLEGHGAAVNSIAIRGRQVVSVSGDRHVKVWDWPTMTCTMTIPAHEKGVACVEFDGRRIVSGSSDCAVSIFDAPTGVNIATLKGHEQLVRTLQAGFGDLPYSRHQDIVDARRINQDFLEAVNSGRIDLEDPRPRAREASAGGSRPEDIHAYGNLSLPPDGGGGRRYGRIVSGSYDHSIIIWRRDKEGVWKPAHRLRQNEAATAAHQRAMEELENPDPVARLAQQSSVVAQACGLGQVSLPMPNVHDSQPYLSSGIYTALIDQVVLSGSSMLQQALANYPGLLAHYTYLQKAIDRETSQDMRRDLRLVLEAAVNGLQTARRLQRQESMASNISMAPTAGSAASQGVASVRQGSQTSTTDNDGDAPMPAAPLAQTPAPPAESHQHHTVPSNVPTLHANPPANALHPGQPLPFADNASCRVFKLQFDARKLICCSQASILVGWDFCNGDPELEEASRFFAAID